MKKVKEFQIWWDEIGSGIKPITNEDMEDFGRRIASIAWDEGATFAEDEKQSICKAINSIDTTIDEGLQEIEKRLRYL